MTTFTPSTSDEVLSAVQWALSENAPLEVLGAGTKRGIGRPPQAAHTLDLSHLTGVTLYEPEELVLTAKAGTPLAEIEKMLAERNQEFAFEPIDYGPLLGQAPGRATIGGVLAANLSGPRRLKAGAARDHILGIRAVSGRGEAFKSGGRVVKNVTGYDLSKLMAGSWGTLAAVTELTFKVLPAAETETTLALRGLADEDAVEAMALAMGSSAEISGAAHLPQGVADRLAGGALGSDATTLLRVEGFGPSVDYRISHLKDLLQEASIDEIDADRSRAVWRDVRDCTAFADAQAKPVWRVSMPPSHGHRMVYALRMEAAVEAFYDWQGGLIWLRIDGEPEAGSVRRLVASHGGGHATLVRASPADRAAIQAFEPQPPALAALSARLKEQFDPQGILNPGADDLMQTNFSTAQLADPHVAESEKILRKCVHCGFCTATCPTYVTLGNELDSPRGRIYLIKDMLENGRPADAEIVTHIDRCLSCLACMTTCPSGVNYMHLVDHARAHIEQTYKRPPLDRLIRAMLAWVLPHPRRFRAALALAKFGLPFAAVLDKIPSLKPFAAMLALAPAALPAKSAMAVPAVHAATATRRGRVTILTGCAQSVLDPGINEATIRLLTRLGIEVVVPRGEACCGSLVHHMGREQAALEAARRNIDVWVREIETGGLDAIIVTASGCGTTIKDYGFMLRLDPVYAGKAARISALARDVTEYLAALELPEPAVRPGLVVAYHSACSMQHGQKITRQPKELLGKAGFVVKEPREGHLCCGSAGTYNIMQPAIATELRDRKVKNIAATGADVVATGNIGCITQIADRAGMPIVHTVQLLDWAYGGPKPKGL